MAGSVLRFGENRILRMSVAREDIDGSVLRMFWRHNGSSGGQLSARLAGDPIYRAAGEPVRGAELFGDGRVRPRQGGDVALDRQTKGRRRDRRQGIATGL